MQSLVEIDPVVLVYRIFKCHQCILAICYYLPLFEHKSKYPLPDIHCAKFALNLKKKKERFVIDINVFLQYTCVYIYICYKYIQEIFYPFLGFIFTTFPPVVSGRWILY